jgi:hypothetical protein
MDRIPPYKAEIGKVRVGQVSQSKSRQAWKLVDLLLLAGLLYFGMSILRAGMDSANLRGEVIGVSHEAQVLYDAFQAYYTRNQSYPASYTNSPFDADTLEPLVRRGYYRGSVTSRLVDQKADAYGSPDDRGINQEFWLEFSLDTDPTVRFLIVHSDDAPLAGGEWYDGAYVYQDGKLEQL